MRFLVRILQQFRDHYLQVKSFAALVSCPEILGGKSSTQVGKGGLRKMYIRFECCWMVDQQGQQFDGSRILALHFKHPGDSLEISNDKSLWTCFRIITHAALISLFGRVIFLQQRVYLAKFTIRLGLLKRGF